MSNLLFDTCSFLWWTAGSERMSRRALDALRQVDVAVFLSVASLVEIAGLKVAGRIDLTVSAARARAREFGIAELAIDGVATERLAALPLRHRDPFDRLLIAQAVAAGAAIMTPDLQIASYDVEVIW